MVALLVGLAVVSAACSSDSGGDEEAGGSDGEPAAEEVSDDDAVAAAEAWLDDWSELDEEGRASLELDRAVRSRGVTHVHFAQQFDDIRVRGAEVIVHVKDDGEVRGANTSLTDARPDPGVEQQVEEAEATDIANKAVPGEVRNTASARVVWLPDGDNLRLGWSVLMSTEGSGAYLVWVDAVSGEVADARPVVLDAQAGGGCDLADAEVPSACVFLPDPVFGSQEEIGSVDEADDFLFGVELLGLDDDSGSLIGEFVNTEPEIPGLTLDPVQEEDGLWEQGRDDEGFEQAMAYVWIDRTQRHMQELGFSDVLNRPFSVVGLEPEVVDNAFFNPADDAIFLGTSPDTGIDLGEDANVVVHEYGHAVLHAQVPNMIQSQVGGAYHEAFGDLLALFMTLEFRAGDAGCLSTWAIFGGTDCLRRLDEDKVFPDDLVNEEHDDGEIYTGAVFDIFEGLLDVEGLTIEDCVGADDCNDVRDRLLTTLLASHEFLTGAEDLPEVAAAFQAANDTAFDGADGDLIAAAFADHGLDGTGDNTADPDGGTGDTAGVAVAIDIAHDFRGDLRLQVGVADAEGNDLCEPITVLEPDGNDAGQDIVGQVDISDTECAQLGAPSPDNQWFLFVQDEAELDEGTVNAFKVIVEGQPFLATGVPAPIADNDPTGTLVIVNGSGTKVPSPDQQMPGEQNGDVLAAVELSIVHTFVGDLSIRAGVADPDGNVLCSVSILDPDPQDDGDDVSGIVDMSDCADFPPSAENLWFLEVIDNAAEDAGTIDGFSVLAPDGTVVATAPDLPVEIPDADEVGVAVIALP
jgi:subtilisin-like proprotein convertase family protein